MNEDTHADEVTDRPDGRRLPLSTDGRDLDGRLAELTGTGAGQRAAPLEPDRPMPGAGEAAWDRVPSERGDDVTYYDQPVVKAPPWGPPVPAYLVLGGACGAATVLAAASGDPRLTRAAGRAALGTGIAGSLLLVSDLGRPMRALNMMRVARPTSPMSVGVYLLSGTIGAGLAAMVLRHVPGPLGRLAPVAQAAAAVLGAPLTGYTGVLLATTALPGWNVGMTTLPPLFTASAASTAACLLTVTTSAAPAAVDVYRTAGQVAELVAERAHERRVREVDGLEAVYRSRRSWRAGRWLTAASLAAGAVPALRRRRAGRVLIGLTGLAGSVATKVGAFEAGMASVADPRLVDHRGGA